eukprot:1920747-Rhodomonas_salina.2
MLVPVSQFIKAMRVIHVQVQHIVILTREEITAVWFSQVQRSATFLRKQYKVSGTDLAYDTPRSLTFLKSPSFRCAISLRACYAMSGTDQAYDTMNICRRAYCAISGTDLAYADTRATLSTLRFSYAPTNRRDHTQY